MRRCTFRTNQMILFHVFVVLVMVKSSYDYDMGHAKFPLPKKCRMEVTSISREGYIGRRDVKLRFKWDLEFYFVMKFFLSWD